MATTKPWNGLPSVKCACGDHVFAYPYDDALHSWRELQSIHPILKARLAEQGVVVDKPPPPTPPHVILLSPADAQWFDKAKWRVLDARNKRYRVEVKRRVVGKALHRLLMPGAPIVEFLNSWGSDLRRSNMRETTMKELKNARAPSLPP